MYILFKGMFLRLSFLNVAYNVGGGRKLMFFSLELCFSDGFQGDCSADEEKRVCTADYADRISDLPRNVLEKLLTCMPLRDAVRTCVLSKKWRYMWVTIPYLSFDDNFGRPPGKSQPTMDKLLLNIFQVLLRHQGSLEGFALSIPYLRSCPEIDQFILFLSGKGINLLRIKILSGDPYKLPLSLFSCQKLSYLHLCSCVFNPPLGSFQGFSRLATLKLETVDIAANLNDFILKCPLLVTLAINNCSQLDHLEIDAPNLNSFQFEGDLNSICFKNTPLLERVMIDANKDSFTLSRQGSISNFFKVFSSLPALKILTASHPFFKYLALGDISEKPAVTLNRLKTIELKDICLGAVGELSCALCLIKCSPNLQEICIEVNAQKDPNINPALDMLGVQDVSDYCLDKLKEVNLHIWSGTKDVMEFVKFLLAGSSVLEKMVIKPQKALPSEDVVNILKEITCFRRASPKAELIFIDPPAQSNPKANYSSRYY
ncbi:hypothetical protein Tsubulata_036888 [Turnera subulata]|uniref:FBD domain-containing protein n=1 Tax=Turnera subulata TaxID=218843 RepID=A0A9Q0EYX4_9ROSI|nr:hypothetical protein Tsubulata_036888 [Turnera subulata]